MFIDLFIGVLWDTILLTVDIAWYVGERQNPFLCCFLYTILIKTINGSINLSKLSSQHQLYYNFTTKQYWFVWIFSARYGNANRFIVSTTDPTMKPEMCIDVTVPWILAYVAMPKTNWR